MLYINTEEVRRGARQLGQIASELRAISGAGATFLDNSPLQSLAVNKFRNIFDNKHQETLRLCERVLGIADMLYNHARHIDNKIAKEQISS
jgi:hypothetical protein